MVSWPAGLTVPVTLAVDEPTVDGEPVLTVGAEEEDAGEEEDEDEGEDEDVVVVVPGVAAAMFVLAFLLVVAPLPEDEKVDPLDVVAAEAPELEELPLAADELVAAVPDELEPDAGQARAWSLFNCAFAVVTAAWSTLSCWRALDSCVSAWSRLDAFVAFWLAVGPFWAVASALCACARFACAASSVV